VHPNDRRRVVRALELAEAGASLRAGEDRLWSGETRPPHGDRRLDVPSAELEARIEKRTRGDVLSAGVEDEVRPRARGPDLRHRPRGLRLDAVVELPRDEAIEAIRRADAPLRRVPAHVDAPDPGLVPVGRL
jgi:hypothetical protein